MIKRNKFIGDPDNVFPPIPLWLLCVLFSAGVYATPLVPDDLVGWKLWVSYFFASLSLAKMVQGVWYFYQGRKI